MSGMRRCLRKLADAASQCASRIMPQSHQRWMLATRNELHAIVDERAALCWALGGLRTACAARWRSLRLRDRRSVRWSGAAVTLCCAFAVTFPTLMTLAFRLQRSELLEALGQMTPGDDWHRLVPLMQHLPDWVHAALLAAGLCYLAGAMAMLRRRSAAVAVMAGVVLDLATRAWGQVYIEPADVVVRDPSLLAQVMLPVVLPLLSSFTTRAGESD